MSKMSREKGKRFERYLANFFKEWGYDTHRTAQYRGNTGQAGDVEGLPGIHIEAKHQEAMRLYEWMEQATHDATAQNKGNIPVVIHKANNKPVLVTMELENWVQLYNEFISGKELQDGNIKE